MKYLINDITMSFPVELALLVISVLFFMSILASKAGYKFGVPALLLFLAVGMFFGSDGLGIEFENINVTQSIGAIALCVILFSGGLDTKFQEIRPVFLQGALLATVGVFMTAFILGGLIWWIFGFSTHTAGVSFISALLLASIVSSTDSASVFSILRSKGLKLKNNLRPMLELESGSNDPMAYILTITLTQIIVSNEHPSVGMVGLSILMQLVIGAAFGYIFGRIAVKVINRIKLHNGSLYPILLLTVCLFIFSSVYYLKGNAYLAVYVGGLVIGNSQFAHRRSSMNFFDGIAWLCQLMMFLTLGLLVNPHELVPLLIPGIIISLTLILIVRPISVFLCLSPFRKIGWRDKTFVSWVGLRGAVPIIFAIIPLSAGIPDARLLFNVVFLCTLISLILQGTTLSSMAKWLKLSEQPTSIRLPENFDIEFSDEIKSVLTEVDVTPDMLANGACLKHIKFPTGTLAIMVKRDNHYFVPTGNTELAEHDKLLIVTDDHEALVAHELANVNVSNQESSSSI